MRSVGTLISLLMLCTTASFTDAPTVIFEDDFSKDVTDGKTRYELEDLVHWTVSRGNVDAWPADGSGEIDLAGTTGGTIKTKRELSLAPGTYSLDYTISTTMNPLGKGEVERLTVSLGDLWSTTHTLTVIAARKTYHQTITVKEPTQVRLAFSQEGNDNSGVHLHDVKLVRVETDADVTDQRHSAVASPATWIGEILFEDDFATDAEAGKVVYEAKELRQWNVVRGNIDVWQDAGTGEVDLAGTMGGTMETKQAFDLRPGRYAVLYTLTTTTNPRGRGEIEKVDVSLGDVWSTTHTLKVITGRRLYCQQIIVTRPTMGRITFRQHGTDNSGVHLRDVSLVRILPHDDVASDSQ